MGSSFSARYPNTTILKKEDEDTIDDEDDDGFGALVIKEESPSDNCKKCFLLFYFHSFSILLPRSWRGYLDAEEATGLSSRQPDVIVMKNGHTRQRSPYVEHSRGRDE